MDYNEFLVFSKHCTQIWAEFKASFESAAMQSFLKKSHPVLVCSFSQISLSDISLSSIVAVSPGSLVSGQEISKLIEKMTACSQLKKKNDAGEKNELMKLEKWIQDFKPEHLRFHPHRLEIRFPSIEWALIEEIKNSPYADKQLTGKSRASIKVVLKS